jgi:hypothetical protein
MALLIDLYYIIMDEIRIILNCICTFGSIEGKQFKRDAQAIQAIMNSTGVLFTYL